MAQSVLQCEQQKVLSVIHNHMTTFAAHFNDPFRSTFGTTKSVSVIHNYMITLSLSRPHNECPNLFYLRNHKSA